MRFLIWVGVGLLVVGFFFLSAWLLMLLLNYLFAYYSIKELDYSHALAANTLLWFFFGGLRGSNNKD